jgi:NAD(P)-dependent dehydrogenase (short-subunit alcohol dehydrogenase family)
MTAPSPDGSQTLTRRGRGKEVATRFVTEGGSVVINGRDRAKAEAAAHQIDPKGKRAVVHIGDIALPATGEAVVKTAVDRFGHLDVHGRPAVTIGGRSAQSVASAL